MSEYVSKFTGQEIDEFLQKSKDISKTAQEVNTSLATVDSIKSGIDNAEPGEVLLKDSTGELKGSGIVDEGDKIFFPKDGRFPSGSVDVGPAVTISENGGWVQNHTNTLDQDYIFVDYQVTKRGTTKPVYWERGPEEKNVVINAGNSTTMRDVTVFDHVPTADSQVNAIYFDFAAPVTNFRAEIVSLDTNIPIKYIPNESAWKNNTGGLDLPSGIQNVLDSPKQTPISALTSYNLRFNIKADGPVSVMGDGVKPYLAVDRQPITAKNILVEGDASGGGSTVFTGLSDTPSAYTGQADKYVRVKNDESGLEFTTSSASVNIDGVPDADFLNKGVQAGLLQQDLADVDLQKLYDKAVDAKLAAADMRNITELTLDQRIKETQFYKTIWSRLPQLKGVKGKYIEQQDALTADQFNTPEQIIHVVYQISAENQIINQTLPPTTIDKVVVIQMIYSDGITNGSVRLTPDAGDTFNGSSSVYVIDKEGVEGIAFAEVSNWDFIPYSATGDTGIEVNDQRSNFFLGTKGLAFGAGFTAVQDPNQKDRVQIEFDSAATESWEDTEGAKFNPALIKSTIKDIEIHQVDNPDGSKTANLNVAPWVTNSDHNEGIHVCLGNDQVINSKYNKSKLYFSDTRVKGGKYVYADMQTKSFIIQDVDPQDDPNVSGGSTFIIALYYEPNQLVDNTLTQDGSIELEFVDDDDNPILNTDGNPMGAKIDYKAGEVAKPELYIGECKAKGFTKVHLKIKLDFENEEIVTAGANTQLCIQSISQKESSGIALLSFMAYTGFRISFDTIYYGYNSLNLARLFTFDQPETEFEPSSNSWGENLYFDNQSKIKVAISNYHLIIKDNNVDLPVWSLSKVYGRLDSKYMSGKNYRVKATLTDKNNAFVVAMLEYKGTTFPAPHPKLLSYNNTSPIFTTGWSKVDQMFISEDVVAGDHTQSKDFIVPDNSKGIAIVMYPLTSQIPSTLSLKDLEGDITPTFSKVFITDSSHITEEYLKRVDYKYKGVVYTPKGYASYRYTCGNVNTKVPVGVITGGDEKVVNDNAWSDPGSFDPNKTQGDIKFLAEGDVKMTYTAKCYNKTGTLNEIHFWLSKVNGDGTFTEVPNSRVATTIEAHRTKPKMVTVPQFTFFVKPNESYRMFMKSDVADGFYIQSETNGVAAFRIDIDFDEFLADEKDVLDRVDALEQSANEIRFVDGDKEVYDKVLEYDVTTGKMKVVDK